VSVLVIAFVVHIADESFGFGNRLAFDFGVENSPLGLPQIEIGLFTVLSVLWICTPPSPAIV